jgi:hypothetical protein
MARVHAMPTASERIVQALGDGMRIGGGGWRLEASYAYIVLCGVAVGQAALDLVDGGLRLLRSEQTALRQSRNGRHARAVLRGSGGVRVIVHERGDGSGAHEPVRKEGGVGSDLQ